MKIKVYGSELMLACLLKKHGENYDMIDIEKFHGGNKDDMYNLYFHCENERYEDIEDWYLLGNLDELQYV